MESKGQIILGVLAAIAALFVAFGLGAYTTGLFDLTNSSEFAGTSTKTISAQDLLAQQQMARWTRVMGVIAAIGTALSMFGIFLLWRTWEATRIAAEAGSEANKIAQNALVGANRAWLKVNVRAVLPLEIRACDDDEEVRLGVLLDIVNVGNSPATNISIEIKLVGDLELKLAQKQIELANLHLDSNPAGWMPNSTLFPEEEYRQQWGLGSGITEYSRLKAAWPSGKNIVVPLGVVGVVQYRLPGGPKLHQTGFAYRLTYWHDLSQPHGTIPTLADLPIDPGSIILSPPFDGHGRID